MIKFVVKRDGTKESFDPEKIKKGIRAATRKANLSEERTVVVVEEVLAKVLQSAEGREEIPTLAIRDKILSELDVVEPAASAAWREYKKEQRAG
ncbi:MAG: ATP cone domain-containing protein [bacterium]|nr:ATP cone domain-containing protein [bacterium]